MATGLGHQTKAAIIRDTSAWGTATEPDAADGERIPYISESIAWEWEKVTQQELRGVAGKLVDHKVLELVQGSFDTELTMDTDAEGFEMLLTMAMGAVAWQAGETANRYTVADELAALYHGTMEIDKKVSNHRFENCKFNGFTISASASDPILKATWDMSAYGIDFTTTGFSNITTTSLQRWLFSDFTMRIGDTDNVLASGDNTPITDFSLSFSRGLSAPEATSGSTSPIEPKEESRREITFSFTLPRYDSDTLITEWTGDDLLQILLFAADAQGGSNDFYIYLPAVKIRNPQANVADAGIIRPTFTCDCFLATTTGTPDANNYMLFLDGSTKVGDNTTPRDLAIEIHSERTDDPSGF